VPAVATLSVTAGTFLGGVLPELLAGAGLGLVARDRVALLITVSIGALGAVPILRLGQAGGDAAAWVGASAIAGAAADETRSRTRRLVRQYACATALISVGAGAFLPFVNVYLARLGAGAGQIGALLAGTGALGAVLGLLGPALARRVGRERLAVTLRVLPVVPALAVLAFPIIPLVVLTHATRQIGAGMTWPIEASILNDRVHPRARAGAFGLRTAAWNLAWAISSTASGLLIVRGGYNAPLMILIGSTVLGALALSLVLRPTPEERAERGALAPPRPAPVARNQ
jgi:MFS family permease